MKEFKLKSPYKPLGDQPKAINSLVEGINNGVKEQIPRINIEDYPAIKAYLDMFWEKINYCFLHIILPSIPIYRTLVCHYFIPPL